MSAFFQISIMISLSLLCLAFILVFIRMLLGPSLPDRVVALDVSAMLAISFISIFCIVARRAIYLDIVIAIALITFLGTIAFAQFIERQTQLNEEEIDE